MTRLSLLLLYVAATAVRAAGPAAPALQVRDAWVRAVPGADTAAVYLELHNGGERIITLTAVTAAVAHHAMLHESRLLAGRSTMRMRDALALAPGQSVRLAPGGLHIMLDGLKHPLKAGDSVALTLVLADGTDVPVRAPVRPLTAG